MKKILIVIAACIGMAACTHDAATFERLMRQEGITNAEKTGYALWGCSKNDDVATGFIGTKNGVRVEGVICGEYMPWGKANTIRYR